MPAPAIALDPALFSMALIGDEDSAQRLIRNFFIAARAIREEQPFAVYLLDDTAERLAAAGAYPASNLIAEMLTRSGLDYVYTAQDLRVAINQIIGRASQLSTLSGVSFLVPTRVATAPPIGDGLNPELREGAQLTAIHVALALKKLRRELAAVTIADLTVNGQITLDADIDLIDPPLQPAGITKLVGLAEILSAASDIAAYLASISPQVLWEHASNSNEHEFAVTLGAINLRRSSGCATPEESCASFQLGPRFIESLSSWQAQGDGKHSTTTFDTCCRLVARMPKEEVKRFFQKSASGRHVFVVRDTDGAKAFRTHITKGHEGLRLLFWERADGTLELANVGGKDELKIV